MAYILLITGILLMIYGLTGLRKDKGSSMAAVQEESAGKSEFESILINSEILHKLNIIDEKIDALSIAVEEQDSDIHSSYDVEDAVKAQETQLSIGPEDIKDVNRKIIYMRNEGMGIEEIANELGLMKGEVLLRLGMKK